MDWEECLTKKIARSSEADLELINSLKQTSENKRLSGDILPLNETTTTSKISLYYDSARELLEALAVSKNFKIYNHECYACFLKEIVKKEELAKLFDRLRILRNSLNYYGQSIGLTDASQTIDELRKLITDLKSLMN